MYLDQLREDIKKRLQELEPYVREYDSLQAALENLNQITPQSVLREHREGEVRRRDVGLSDRMLQLLNQEPGLRAREIADRLGANPTSVHSTLTRLRQLNRVRNDEYGRNYPVPGAEPQGGEAQPEATSKQKDAASEPEPAETTA
jgi:DNA-directed RNA polymerase specialized sigma24 family protein